MKNISKGKLIGIIAGIAAIILTSVLIVVESCGGGHLYLENTTDKDITSIIITFYDEEQDMLVDYLYEGTLKAGEKLDYVYKDDGGFYYFDGMYCTCDMYVTFDGCDEMLFSDGEFTSTFKGNFDFKFYQKNGEYKLYMKAYEGLFRSTKSTRLDTPITIDFENADWDFD